MIDVMATVKEKTDSECTEWSPEEEIQLFFAMDGLKPIGINRHFFIVCVVERLSKALNREINSDAVWSHLKTMYNLKALNEQEQLPFPNEESDFCLPETDFSLAIKQKSVEEQSAEENKKSEVKPESVTKSVKDKEQLDKEKDKQNDKEKDSKSAKMKAEVADNTPKRPQKRTRGSMSLEPNAGSPSTPQGVQITKRRRI
ncbi:MRG/MORF4L-binding protein [Topomyia yanbarensis]|uniref:MRG/MORF4L-binding protein n=1 Tax=Topomyia yanbarensis TaxID=2498891 RepID=UPI00273B9410|nr:MRG/MORF4L-binding protein [Topomyia yanbarensis]